MTQSSSPQVVLVTGSKSGIGKAILSTYASRPNHIVIAAIRSGTSNAAASDLTSLPVGKDSRVIVAAYDASSTSSAKQLLWELQSKHRITYLTTVVANAGILSHFGPAATTPVESINEHFVVNTLGPILLYQATSTTLKEAPVDQTPKFFVISSSLGSNTLMADYAPMKLLPYGMSKAAVNFAISRFSYEDERIVFAALQPGWVQTDMGGKAAELLGYVDFVRD